MFFVRLSLLLLALMMAGCATVNDIRAKSPDHRLDSVEPPKEIANRVLHEAPAKVGTYIYTLSENPSGTFNIFIASPAPVGDATFAPDGKGGSHIEFRYNWNFWAHDSFWDLVKQCASPKRTALGP